MRLLTSPHAPEIAAILTAYGNSAIAYDFAFDIEEANGLSANLAFQMPFTVPKVFDLSAGGSVDKVRSARRTFRSQQTFKDLVDARDWCAEYFGKRSQDLPKPKNLLHPISGSIGMDKVVETFMRLSEQGGGKDNFVDSLRFTTTIKGSLNASVRLEAVSHAFRLVSARAAADGERRDIHAVKVSLAFPIARAPVARPRAARAARAARRTLPPTLYPDSSNQSVRTRSPIWRARYNLCVADARDREDQFRVLRDQPPEIYCMKYADAFVPLPGSSVRLRCIARGAAGALCIAAKIQTSWRPSRRVVPEAAVAAGMVVGAGLPG